MPKYRILRGKVSIGKNLFPCGKDIELDEEHAARFPGGTLQLLPEEKTETIEVAEQSSSKKGKKEVTETTNEVK
jgi:hypothetical protein